jgi:hypothetical protein
LRPVTLVVACSASAVVAPAFAAAVNYPEYGQKVSLGSIQMTKMFVWLILLTCVAGLVLALVFLSGTWLGFGLAFGSGILAYECVIVLKRIRAASSVVALEKQRIAV